MKVYNKLVRDNIPAIIESTGKKFTCHIASDEEYQEKLQEKLLEEVNEFLEDPSLEEMVDVFEVLGTLLWNMGYSEADFDRARDEKNFKRGAFDSRIILESVEE